MAFRPKLGSMRASKKHQELILGRVADRRAPLQQGARLAQQAHQTAPSCPTYDDTACKMLKIAEELGLRRSFQQAGVKHTQFVKAANGSTDLGIGPETFKAMADVLAQHCVF